ncbi:MAG: hypothetical protein V3S17_00575 [candidate division Zixibacteria bacterium]
MELSFQNIAVWAVMFGAAAYLAFYVYRQLSTKSGCAACQLKQTVENKDKPATSRQAGT